MVGRIWIRPFARVLVTALLIALVVRSVDLAMLADTLAQVSTRWIIAAIASWMLGAVIVPTARWSLLLPNETRAAISFRELWKLTHIGMLYALALGGQVTGDAIKAARLCTGRTRRGALVTSIAVDRVCGLVGLVVIAAAACAVTSADPFAVDAVLASTGVVSAAVSIGALMMPTRSAASFNDGALRARIRSTLNSITSATRNYRHRLDALGAATITSCASQFALSVAGWCCFQALGVDVPLVDVMWLLAVTLIAQSLPVSIGGIGPREATVVVLAASASVSEHVALAWAVLLLICQVAVALPGAAIELAPASRRRQSTPDVLPQREAAARGATLPN
jgi:uncharacterized protein (TIRG00374 family)